MFVDRRDAGRRLGLALRRDLGTGRADVVVIGLSRGGMLIASEIAEMLGGSLEALAVRELCAPGVPGVVFGAIGEGGVRVLNKARAVSLGLDESDVRALEMAERVELERQALRFRGERARIPLTEMTAVVVDDGVGAASTARAACAIARAEGAIRVLLAIPAASMKREHLLAGVADELVALQGPAGFDRPLESASDVPDMEVSTRLEARVEDRVPVDEDVDVDLGDVRLSGHLSMGAGCTGLVVLVDGDGSSRRSPHTVFVAGMLRRAGIGTLLLDLASRPEERDSRTALDIEPLSERLVGATSLLRRRPEIADARIGYFGVGAGAAVAMRAAVDRRVPIEAVVSEEGRLDLVESLLPELDAPTLLLVNDGDRRALELNRRASGLMRGTSRLWVVSGADSTSAVSTELETVAHLARIWFGAHLVGDRSDVAGLG